MELAVQNKLAAGVDTGSATTGMVQGYAVLGTARACRCNISHMVAPSS